MTNLGGAERGGTPRAPVVHRLCTGIAALGVCLFGAAPAKAQSAEAQRLAVMMAYCVSAIASNTVNISSKPVGVQIKGRRAEWRGGGEDGMRLQQLRGDWECTVSSQDPTAMARAAKGFLRGIKGAEITTQRWRSGQSEAVLASACVARKRITFVANGPIGEGGKFGFTRITDKFREVRPC